MRWMRWKSSRAVMRHCVTRCSPVPGLCHCGQDALCQGPDSDSACHAGGPAGKPVNGGHPGTVTIAVMCRCTVGTACLCQQAAGTASGSRSPACGLCGWGAMHARMAHKRCTRALMPAGRTDSVCRALRVARERQRTSGNVRESPRHSGTVPPSCTGLALRTSSCVPDPAFQTRHHGKAAAMLSVTVSARTGQSRNTP